MNGATSARSPASPTPWLAFTCVAVWLVAAVAARALGIWLAIGAAAIALGAGIVVLDSGSTRRLLTPRPRLLFMGTAAGCVMAAGTYLLYPVLARRLPFVVADSAALYASFRTPPSFVATLALVPVILGEELAWRGVVQAVFIRRLGNWRGVTLGAAAYALAHAPLGSPLLVVLALLCGLVWGTLRATTGSLLPTLCAHVVWDFLVLLWLPLDAS